MASNISVKMNKLELQVSAWRDVKSIHVEKKSGLLKDTCSSILNMEILFDEMTPCIMFSL